MPSPRRTFQGCYSICPHNYSSKHFACLTDEETETQQVKVAFPRSPKAPRLQSTGLSPKTLTSPAKARASPAACPMPRLYHLLRAPPSPYPTLSLGSN